VKNLNGRPSTIRVLPTRDIDRLRGKKTRYCEHPECGAYTKHNKPFCIEHVEQMPYVQTVLARITKIQSTPGFDGRRGW
jgi:hypothetical protein